MKALFKQTLNRDIPYLKFKPDVHLNSKIVLPKLFEQFFKRDTFSHFLIRDNLRNFFQDLK